MLEVHFYYFDCLKSNMKYLHMLRRRNHYSLVNIHVLRMFETYDRRDDMIRMGQGKHEICSDNV